MDVCCNFVLFYLVITNSNNNNKKNVNVDQFIVKN